MNHATVKIGDYTIPLIGIPFDATQETCAKCGKSIHISVTMLHEGDTVCRECGNKIAETKPQATYA